jgi:SAM-dependent methyltransferase
MSIVVKDIKEYSWDKPLPFLVEQLPNVPKGRALDLAMGEGRNAVYLAQQGYKVDGIDLSEPSVRKGMGLARSRGAQINGIVADLGHYAIRPNRYDLICCFFFLDRSLFPAMIGGLRPGGAILYQSVTIDELEINPSFPREWCLEPNELLRSFKSLRVLYYRETDPINQESHSALASLLAVRS